MEESKPEMMRKHVISFDDYEELEAELLRIRKALETWRDEWKKANDPDAYWDAYDTITRINAILTPDEKELRGE